MAKEEYIDIEKLTPCSHFYHVGLQLFAAHSTIKDGLTQSLVQLIDENIIL